MDPRITSAFLAVCLAACSGPAATTSADPPASQAEPSPSVVQASAVPSAGPIAMVDIVLNTRLEAGRYIVDPDGDSDTTMRVSFDVPAAGWRAWVGTYKDEGEGARSVGLTLAQPTHVVTDACRQDETVAIGGTLDEAADALAGIRGYEVDTPVTRVAAHGFEGRRLVLRVPDDIAFEDGTFAGCLLGRMKGWQSPTERNSVLERYYQAPGQIIDQTLLNVGGTVLLVEVTRFPQSPAEDLEQLNAILESMEILE